MHWKIPLFRIYWDQDDLDAVSETISGGASWAVGPEIKQFENRLAEYIGVTHAAVFNSGTSALHTLLLAHNVKGKEVIVPSFSFIATCNAVLLAQGKPVFAEIEQETFGLEYEDVKSKITPNTGAILLMHYAGYPARDSLKLKKLAQENDILLIEDAAEVMGAKINGIKCGTIGDSAILSFCQNKIITTGEGGAIVTDSKAVIEKAELIRSHGRVEIGDGFFSSELDNDYIIAGYNYRMPSMNAALGLAQLEKIEKLIDFRRKHAKYYIENLKGTPNLRVIEEPEGSFCVFQMFPIIIESTKLREKLQTALKNDGIMSKVYFNPVHLKTIYENEMKTKPGDLPGSESISDRILSIPIYPDMKEGEQEMIIKSIKTCMGA